jgi:hypothetical protein
MPMTISSSSFIIIGMAKISLVEELVNHFREHGSPISADGREMTQR